MKHPMHPEHTLSLLSQPPYPYCECDACEEVSEAFTYHCSLCNFKLDPVCASQALSIEHESHKHPLIPQLNSASFECYACGTKDEDVSYKCSTCRFWIHEDCALLPNTIKHSGHNHTLTLLYGMDRFTWWFKCKVCFLICRNYRWLYCCQGCGYFVHPKCIFLTKKKESKLAVKVGDIDGSNSIHLPMRDESVRLIDLFVMQICLEDNQKKSKINHFSHNHPLIFYNEPGDDNLCHGNEQYRLDDVNNDKICSACEQIISASFYGCTPCNFFLHKWCANLPDELKHRLHPHPLMLSKEIGRKVFCRNCKSDCKEFCFQCVNPECPVEYCLDVKCASLPSSIVHENHEHPLHLKEDCETEGCAACDRSCSIFSFGCATCNFSLHYRCALLPHTFRHKYDEHPFVLNYGPIENGPDEYICEFCECEIDPKWWFYHCINCDQSACAECILKNVKYFEKAVWHNFKGGFRGWLQRQKLKKRI
ncbi:Nucleoredoxin 1-2 like [Actinidia chinensis var. chinensis]|uniref:Nucleoredoxin 1-2 like n=1 Tax=Actinidia chinensis var. chinensis TaxID=1590841 RepID=A0A2R6QV72_ACTCC|nr:Nucleoredoxin 1-2 like [Actinidia chinensis var. chinensis]